MEKQFYTTNDIIEMTGLSISWIRRRIKEHKIPSYKLGKRRLFKKADIDKWLESHKEVFKK